MRKFYWNKKIFNEKKFEATRPQNIISKCYIEIKKNIKIIIFIIKIVSYN